MDYLVNMTQVQEMQNSNYFTVKRRPIFSFTPHKIHHNSIQCSQIVPQLKGDQTYPYQLDKIVQQLDEYHKQQKQQNNYRRKTTWRREDSSDSSESDLQQQCPFSYSSIKPSSSKDHKQLANTYERRSIQQQNWDIKHLQKSSQLKQIKYQRLQIQNQQLKNHQILLTQILLSNQKKLRNLQQLQQMQKINQQYQKKIYIAKNVVQKWENIYQNNRIVKQLINILNF